MQSGLPKSAATHTHTNTDTQLARYELGAVWAGIARYALVVRPAVRWRHSPRQFALHWICTLATKFSKSSHHICLLLEKILACFVRTKRVELVQTRQQPIKDDIFLKQTISMRFLKLKLIEEMRNFLHANVCMCFCWWQGDDMGLSMGLVCEWPIKQQEEEEVSAGSSQKACPRGSIICQ